MDLWDNFPFRIEASDFKDDGIDEVLAVSKNSTVAQAAYKAALKERPDRSVRLRCKARVVEERLP